MRLDSRPSHFIDGWPTAGHAGQVELSHLLAFTTGFEAMGPGRSGCVRDDDIGSDDWGPCLDEIAGYNITYAPGTTFQYGPWHPLVAAGMALRAEGRNLTRDAWAQLLDETVFAPSGLRDTPAYGAGSAGLQMSARQWQKILHALMFGGLLPPASLGEFTRDHTARVAASVGSRDYAGQYLAGGWHYAQGHYRACDALSTMEERARFKSGRAYSWSEANAKCGFQDNDPAAGPKSNVQHSGGSYGSYVWLDLPDYYYGVYIQFFDPLQAFDTGVKWMVGATVFVWLVACISCSSSSTHVCGSRGARAGIAR